MDKQSFLNEISKNYLFDDSFFKKVYGYAFLDKPFLGVVANKLKHVGRSDVIQKYNKWFSDYEKKKSITEKAVAIWYINECDKKYKDLSSDADKLVFVDNEQNKTKERSTKDWEVRKKELLLQKKRLLLQQKKLILQQQLN